MNFQTVHLETEQLTAGRDYAINAQTLLADLTETFETSPYPYLLVRDDDGAAIGVIAKEDIRNKLDTGNLMERRRWMEMPVEAALQGRMQTDSQVSHHPKTGLCSPPGRCTAVTENGRLIAVLTDHDVLISWRSIAKTLRQAQDDAVTSLPNRACFDLQLRAEFERARRSDLSIAVILIDVDGFKSLNDLLGHPAGDCALRAVGTAVRRTLRSYDAVARYGGDEFAVICCGCLPGEIDTTLTRLQLAVRKLQNDPSLPRPVPTVSIGACVMHNLPDSVTRDALVGQADECLYMAKRAGRNCAYVVETGLDENRIPVPRRVSPVGQSVRAPA